MKRLLVLLGLLLLGTYVWKEWNKTPYFGMEEAGDWPMFV